MARLLPLDQVQNKTGQKRSSIYAKIADGTFPRPVKTGPRASRWIEDEVDAWIESLRSERDSGARGSGDV